MNKKDKTTALNILLKEYFSIAKDERMPFTPEITARLDELEPAIRALKKELKTAK